ncbi:MAG: DNA repair protein RecO [Bacteroidia bacterium]|nr:DNA repair protein RecO [Bacteroidia bacterium]
MIRKTEGIVLRTYKHQDSNLIAKVFTREYGLQTFLVAGHRSSRSRSRHSYFQPLSLIEVVFQERPNRGIQKLSESKLAFSLNEVQTDPVKLSLGLALLEIFADTVGEEENPEHYDFVRSVVIHLDRSDSRLIQIFLYFLVHHTRYLGFYPNDQSLGKESISFELADGTLRPSSQGNRSSALLRSFLHSELLDLPHEASCQQILFSTLEKREFIKMFFDYYRLHITGFRYPQTMRVFAEVFGG